ncbi:hypothetical protein SRHO_G00058510 [Serrasalmus rhombeus]
MDLVDNPRSRIWRMVDWLLSGLQCKTPPPQRCHGIIKNIITKISYKTEQGRENHGSEGPYGLRRRILPSKRLRDYILGGEATSGATGRRRKQAKLQQLATETRVLTFEAGTEQTEGGDGDRTAEPKSPAGTVEPSSFRAETAERTEREAVLQESSIPLLIHGHTTEEYQTIYHSVVDSMVSTASGQPRPYSLELGLRVKQRLWETLRCPTLKEEEQPDGQLGVTEGFSTPMLRSFAPLIEVDISEEPVPKPPKRPRQ